MKGLLLFASEALHIPEFNFSTFHLHIARKKGRQGITAIIAGCAVGRPKYRSCHLPGYDILLVEKEPASIPASIKN